MAFPVNVAGSSRLSSLTASKMLRILDSMDQATDKDIRFCPYCAQMQFEVTGKDERALVYCELCGVDVAVYELIQ